MSLETNLTSTVTRIATELKAHRTLINGNVADLSSLTTSDKTSLVGAVNELQAEVISAAGGGVSINDTAINTTNTWSSSKIDSTVTSRIDAIVAGAPEAMDTLAELAAAWADADVDITTVTTALGNRVRFDEAQSLTGPQQAQARTNIGAGTSNLVIGTDSGTAKAGNWNPSVSNITGTGAMGVSLMGAADAATARNLIGAGTSNLVVGSGPTNAKAGNYQPTVEEVSGATTVGKALMKAADAADARTAIGAGTGNSNLVLGTTSTTAMAGDYAPPIASATAQGVVELATPAEATTGTDSSRAVTPAGLKAVADTKAASTHTHTLAQVSDASDLGRQTMAAANAASFRSLIGAGTGNSNLVIGTTSTTAKAGDYTPPTATTSIQGIVELATTTEAESGTDPSLAVTPLGLKTVADTKAPLVHTHNAAAISDSSTIGRAVLTAASAAAARSAIGAGTSSLVIGTGAGDAKAGNWTPTVSQISDAGAVGRNVLLAATATVALSAIGAVSTAAIGDTEHDFVNDFEAALV